MLRIILIIGITIHGICVFSQKLRSHYSYSFSDYYDEQTKTWRPSKCDCDFESGDLHLNNDSSFSLLLNKGRLDVEAERLYGKWHTEKDSILHLVIMEEDLEVFAINADSIRFIRIPYSRNSAHRVYYLRNSRLYDDIHVWK